MEGNSLMDFGSVVEATNGIATPSPDELLLFVPRSSSFATHMYSYADSAEDENNKYGSKNLLITIHLTIKTKFEI